MVEVTGNIFKHILSEAGDEEFTELLAEEGLRIERIVSTGQANPPGFWYDQAWSEWVLVLSGSAGLLFEDEPAPRELKRGDYLLIPAGSRHRVEWTDATEPTIWLAVHFGSSSLNREAAPDNASF
ncbi:cupin [Microvirga vignae]|uniref:Cupin n=1 Tax=Microvirga vignae TaxID=1225564 RepID=A0A0H1R6B4_9HYPH|nr:cupin domain-containing protein [Microvirga vignae]KLK90316.1 cupin [Microvirga vignae]